ncbi:MAG: tyrosine-type recombinase/integrase [Rhodocyclaceae bacterium]|nr:tyrosine-type recombinase/integrase [Rhodocyclaceae bacterium]
MMRGQRTIRTSEQIAVTVNDCAFLRAIIQGVGLLDAGKRYLAEQVDQRELKSHLKALLARYEVHIASTLHKDELTAMQVALTALQNRLARKRPKAAAKLAAPQPTITLPTIPITFDDFNARENPGGGFFRESEIQALYESDVLAPWRAECDKVRANLSARAVERVPAPGDQDYVSATQLDLLLHGVRGFELTEAVEPNLADPLAMWVRNDALLRRLARARLQTVAHLYDRINTRGYNWHDGIAGVGQRKAQQLVSWLTRAAPTLNITVSAAALVPIGKARSNGLIPQRNRIFGVVPFEYMLIPYELAGQNGKLRGNDACAIDVDDDYSAITAFLSTHKAVTERAYRIEAERFLLWCHHQRGIALSSVMVDDCNAYREFLLDPQPRAQWVNPKRCRRDNEAWRPFMKALDPLAAQHSLTILSVLFGWLRDVGYLQINPFAAIKKAVRADSRTDKQALKEALARKARDKRVMQLDVWALVDGYLRTLDTSDAANARKVAVMRLLQGCGLRREEAVLAQASDLTLKTDSQSKTTYYELTVRGKGDKTRAVVVPFDVIDAIEKHFAHRGIGSLEHCIHTDGHRSAYIIGKVSIPKRGAVEQAREGVSDQSLYRDVIAVFQATLASVNDSPTLTADARRKLAQASPHWLRHCFASLAINNDVPAESVQKMLGHGSINTTMIYATKEQAALDREQLRLHRKLRDRLNSGVTLPIG